MQTNFERTFGIEIEMCNVDRGKISLPNGYSWSKDESIFNTDGKSSKHFGGEINTPPLHLCQRDRKDLRDIYSDLKDNGGKIKWSIDTHVHIYAGDLTLDQLKNIFYLLYWDYKFVKRYCHIADWDEMVFNAQPLPTENKYDLVKRAASLFDLEHAFTNQSKKGYLRLAINIASYFVRKTIEFRCFHATDNFELVENCVIASYRMFNFAVTHTEDEIKSISSYDEFCAKLKLHRETPPTLTPLIYQGNPYSSIETFMTNSLPYNSKQASLLYEAIQKNKHTDICVVNGFMYYYELFLLDKINVSIYCQDAYCYLLYLIANGKVCLTYKDRLEWLEDYNDKSVKSQLALALYASSLQKFLMSKSSRNDAIIESLKIKAKESIEKIKTSNDRLLRLLTTCEFKVGTLQDAIKDKQVIFFNYGEDKKQNRTFKLIQECSDLDLNFDLKRNDYYDLVESLPQSSYFYYFSNSPFLSNMHKLAMIKSSNGDRRSAGRFLYCNKPTPVNDVCTSYKESFVDVNEIVPPDDLVIDDPKKLKIAKCNSSYLYCLQKKYIKKVDMVSRCTYAFVVMYDKYTLGGFGFTLPQHKGYDLFQLTDFCTNNEIPRLSKLILVCIQSVRVQMELSRRMHKLCEKVISCAYTHKPVSMKYRGIYKKVKEHCTSSYLAYEGVLGQYADNKAIIAKYQNLCKNGNRR